MPIEIERRFIVKGDEWKTLRKNKQNIQQAYLCTNFDQWIVRVRIVDHKQSKVTFKTKAEGIKTHEFEYSIPITDAISISKLISQKISKTRYTINFENKEWIIDCFQNENHPLVIAELELDNEEEIVQIPSWCDHEITGMNIFSNAALATNPISNWNMKDRQNLNLLKKNNSPGL